MLVYVYVEKPSIDARKVFKNSYDKQSKEFNALKIQLASLKTEEKDRLIGKSVDEKLVSQDE